MQTIIILGLLLWIFRRQNSGEPVVDDSAENWMKHD